jgi:transposase
VERTEEFISTGKVIGIDVGLNHFYTTATVKQFLTLAIWAKLKKL